MSGGAHCPHEQVMLRCPVCSNETPIWRKSSRLKERNHVKHMWCPWCKAVRPFVEVRG